jgi:Ca2+-transporting ATPase
LQPTTVAGEPEIGDPTELALLHAAADRGIRREALLQQSPEVLEDAFDPDSKRMATVHRYKGEYLTAVKGAPEIILSSCTSVLTEHGVAALDARELQRWLSRVRQLCETGRRAIAIATKISATQQTDHYADLTLQGVLGLEDPARDGVADAISRCRDAGVRVVMVTGDHADTAKNIAAQIGIVDAALGNDQFLDGRAVDSLVGSGGQEALRAARVFSRVTPEQKMQLIDLYQQGAHVVAMTGDGVNDAPALKKADIGIAMGLRGTAVARQAAAMVLQDDEFATIVAAIGQGRTIFENIRKFVVYLMSCNSSEVLVVSLATVAGAPLPLLPLQILYLNLVTDVFPALALGVGPGRHAAMLAAPRPASEPILTRNHWIEIGLYGLVMAVVVLAAMATARFWLRLDGSTVVTVSFCTLALAQMWHVFNMRADLGQIANNEIGRNVWIWVALALCSMLVLAAIYVPLLRDIMQLSNPGRSGWLLIVLASLVPLAVAPLVRRIALWPKWG